MCQVPQLVHLRRPRRSLLGWESAAPLQFTAAAGGEPRRASTAPSLGWVQSIRSEMGSASYLIYY